MELVGATVVVTGASHGIGRATALALAGAGAAVVGVGRDRAALDDLVRRTGGTAVVADVTDPGHATMVVEAALADYGRVDALVANAGIGHVGEFAAMPAERIDELFDVNLRAPVRLVRAVLPRLVEQRRGAVVFVTSIAGVLPVAHEAAYCASKTALEAFAESLRAETAGTGVAVSTVRPGVVRTAFHDRRELPYTRRFPRPMAPERVAAAVVDVIRSGAASRTEPRWLDLAVRLREATPWLYRRLSGRFG